MFHIHFIHLKRLWLWYGERGKPFRFFGWGGVWMLLMLSTLIVCVCINVRDSLYKFLQAFSLSRCCCCCCCHGKVISTLPGSKYFLISWKTWLETFELFRSCFVCAPICFFFLFFLSDLNYWWRRVKYVFFLNLVEFSKVNPTVFF